MRRKLVWVLALLMLAALAVPAGAAPRADTGAIHGVIIDGATSNQFYSGVLAVDVFNLTTMQRTAMFLSPSGVGSEYLIENLPAGDYKIRFRWWDDGGMLARYRWWSDKANFEAAVPVTVPAGGSVEADATLKVMRGAKVTGTLVERKTGLPLVTACYAVYLFEASGIGLGWITGPDAFGNWEIPKVPAGKWTALGVYSTGWMDTDGDTIADLDCGTGPAHLDTWYRGASGWPLQAGLVAHWATFSTANLFSVVAGTPTANIDIEMLPAPTCRGKIPTIFGTTLPDEITGTGARDIIAGLAGDDWIVGRAGNDLICGDAGNDNIDAGGGVKDAIDGGPGLADVCLNAETTWRCP